MGGRRGEGRRGGGDPIPHPVRLEDKGSKHLDRDTPYLLPAPDIPTKTPLMEPKQISTPVCSDPLRRGTTATLTSRQSALG